MDRRGHFGGRGRLSLSSGAAGLEGETRSKHECQRPGRSWRDQVRDERIGVPGHGASGRGVLETGGRGDRRYFRTLAEHATATVAWLESHGNANRFNLAENAPVLLDGFVHTAAGLATFDGDPDTKGVRSMGFYTQADLPSPYWFATQFATSDRWYNPEPAQTEATRLYSLAATSQGLVHPPQDSNTQLTAKTIFQLLDAANISWKIYSVDRQPDGKLISNLRNFQPYASTKEDHIVPISQFFTDVQAGTLPQYSYIEPGFASGRDEHPGKSDNLQSGAAFMNSLFVALINSVSWKDSIFIQTFDENGGLFDHVSPMIDGRPIQELAVGTTGQAVGAGKYATDAAIMHVPSPDGIKPSDFVAPYVAEPSDFVVVGIRRLALLEYLLLQLQELAVVTREALMGCRWRGGRS